MPRTFWTPGETQKEREDYWLTVIAEARSYSGGILEYCRDHKIGKNLYYSWFSKLKGKVDCWLDPLDTNRKRRKRPPKPKSSSYIAPRPKSEWRALVSECLKLGLRPSEFARQRGVATVIIELCKRGGMTAIIDKSVDGKTMSAKYSDAMESEILAAILSTRDLQVDLLTDNVVLVQGKDAERLQYELPGAPEEILPTQSGNTTAATRHRYGVLPPPPSFTRSGSGSGLVPPPPPFTP